MRRVERSALQVPGIVVDLELADVAEDEPDKISVDAYRSLWCLARAEGFPADISLWDVSDDVVISRADLRQQLLMRIPDETRRAAVRPETAPDESDVTVVICTRDRPEGLRVTLESLHCQTDPDFRVLVVDNGSPAAGTAQVTEELALPGWEYTTEPIPGLSRARNRGLAEVRTRIVAWMDDDEVADPQWIHRIKQGFGHPSRPVAVCGVIMPRELQHESQVRFEQYGGFNKGRGLKPEVLKAGTPSVISPLYPLPTFGPGGNMAFLTEELRAIGGFDPCLGAGTRTHGCEEIRVFSQLLSNGETVLHWPPAIIWHTHRGNMAALAIQFYGFSAGLSALYASTIRARPSAVFEILRLIPYAWRDLRGSDSNVRSGHLPDDFPAELRKVWRRGLLAGAPMYVYESLRSGRRRDPNASSQRLKAGNNASGT
ncbi:MAG: glycosyltransferase family A protein [Trebonia sp.]|jgi:glycosyltransferase involved in cell wall biosynthesis